MLEQLLMQYRPRYTTDDLPYLSATTLYSGPFDGCGGPLRKIGTFSEFSIDLGMGNGIGRELPELPIIERIRNIDKIGTPNEHINVEYYLDYLDCLGTLNKKYDLTKKPLSNIHLYDTFANND